MRYFLQIVAGILIMFGVTYAGEKHYKIPKVQYENPYVSIGVDVGFLKEYPDSVESLVVIDYILGASEDSIAISELFVPLSENCQVIWISQNTDNDSLFIIDGISAPISDDLIGHRARFFIRATSDEVQVYRIEVMPEEKKLEK